MSLKRYIAFVIDLFIEGILSGALYWILCFSLSFILDNKSTYLYYKWIGIYRFNFLGITYRLGYHTIISLLVSIFVVSLYAYFNGGSTIGDSILKIKIQSKKYNGMKLCLLRFSLRTFTVIFIQIFAIINLILMFLNKRIDICWYDKIIDLDVIYIKE